MIVTINNVTSGTCVWCCQQTDDAVEAVFRDGLQGCLCKRDFWAALRARASEVPKETEKPIASKANS